MNLRTDIVEKDTRPRYWYFFNYAFQTNSGTGEGMCELAYIGKKITAMPHIKEIADYILEDNNNKNDGNEKWKSVLIRNFILLREENTDGIKCGEEKASSEDDPKVFKGSQG